MMIEHLKKRIVFVVCFFVLASTIYGQGDFITENRDVSGFKTVKLGINGNLYVTQGDNFKVAIKAQQKIMEKIKTDLDGDELIIKLKPSIRKYKKIDVYITMPEVEGLIVSGSGDIVGEKLIKTDGIDLIVSGSGSVKMKDLSAKSVHSKISGSGSIYLAGSSNADELSVIISGSGDFEGDSFKSQKASVRISGSGDCDIYAAEKLEVKVSGSGDVRYKGSPQVNSVVSGSGSVRKN